VPNYSAFRKRNWPVAKKGQHQSNPVSSLGESPMRHNREDGFSGLISIFKRMTDIEKRFAGNTDEGV
jgi:hypothetical protein